MAKPEVSVVIRAKDLASTVIGRFRRRLRGIVQTAKDVARGIAAVTAGTAALVVGLTKISERGSKVIAVQRAFARMADNQTASLERLRKASAGTIADFDLMAFHNQALALGAARTTDEFADMIEMSRALGRAQGIEATEALSKFTVGLARQSKLRLDDLGIIIDVEKANEQYAATLGISADKLTDQQKKQAFVNEALRQGRDLMERMGDTTLQATDAANRASTMFANLRDRIAEVTAQSPMVATFFDGMSGLLADIIDLVSDDRETLVDGMKALGGLAGSAFAGALLKAVGAAFSKLDTMLLPKFFGIEEKFMTFVGAIGQGLSDLGEERFGDAAAFRTALSAAAGAGRARANARARATGGAGGRTGGSGGSGLLSIGLPGPATLGGRNFVQPMAPLMMSGAGMRGLLASQGLGTDFRGSRLGPELDDAAESFDGAAQTAVASFGAMAEAAIRGGNLTADSVIGMMSRIIQNLPGVGGLAGSLIGAAGGILGGLFSRGSRPAAVNIADISRSAAKKMTDAATERPLHVRVTNITPEGRTIEETEYILKNRQRRDAVPRFTRKP